jgi:hypothetical protein
MSTVKSGSSRVPIDEQSSCPACDVALDRFTEDEDPNRVERIWTCCNCANGKVAGVVVDGAVSQETRLRLEKRAHRFPEQFGVDPVAAKLTSSVGIGKYRIAKFKPREILVEIVNCEEDSERAVINTLADSLSRQAVTVTSTGSGIRVEKSVKTPLSPASSPVDGFNYIRR